MGIVTYKHWGPSGDLLSCLPGMRQIWRETGKKAVIMQRLNVIGEVYEDAKYAIFDDTGTHVCMSAIQWQMLYPLLEAQEYIEKCEIWEGQHFEVDLDRLRENAYTPAPHGDLYFWQQLLIPQMATFLGEPWLEVPDSPAQGQIIVNRTERYNNQLTTYYFLKDYQDKLMFAGTDKERDVFCKQWNLDIPRVMIKDFLHLAKIIKACRFFIGNQSMCYHIAEGIGKKRLLEICPRIANVWPHTKEGYPYMHQVTLEYYWNKFINE